MHTVGLVHTGATAYLLEWPEVVQADTVILFTAQGEAVHVPTVADQCWLAPLPCTPLFNEALRIERDAAGVPRQLSVPPEP